MKKLLLILLYIPLFGVSQIPLPISPSSNIIDDKLSLETGCVFGDCENGIGKYVFEDGDTYIGEWKYGMKHGNGIKIYGGKFHGDKYVGEWKDIWQDGYGTFIRDNGDQYVGEFKRGTYHGRGTYITFEGKVYEGLWENGKFIGE